MRGPIRVLVADDHPLVRQGVCAYLALQADIQVVGEATNGSQALRMAAEHNPDVVLMDLAMPGMDGIEATMEIKRVNPQVKVIVLSSFHEDDQVIQALKAGAVSYLLKDVAPDELVSAVRRAALGESTLSSRVAGQVITALAAPQDPSAENHPELSQREIEVLRLVAHGNSNATISDRLTISEKTVKSHVSSILFKLDVSDRTQAAAYAWRKGLVKQSDQF